MKGIGASGGYCIGKVWVKKELVKIEKERTEQIEVELTNLKKAIAASKEDLQRECAHQVAQLGEAQGEIFKAHEMMLSDPELIKAMEERIKNEKMVAPFAVQETMEAFIALFEAMDNPYFKERALDVKDIGIRVIKKLIGVSDVAPDGVNVVVVAKDLTPSDTAKLDVNKVKGFVTAQGGDTSHSAIIARTMGIPAIMGVKGIDELAVNGDEIILDGFTGEVFMNPEASVKALYEEKLRHYLEEEKALMAFKTLASETLCGEKIEIAANIASPVDVEKTLAYGADGVGLFRSEFLYMNRNTPPTEEEQFLAYKAVLEGMGDKPVVIRTLDAGGDKMIPYLNIPEEMNPFLGYRAIRLCFDELDLFKTQLRALLRASVFGNLKIMYPMISSVEEVRKAKGILNEVREALKCEGIAFSDAVEEGIMIEIPAAAVIADLLAKEVDFFSIGTNDLIQYTNAVDRMNEHIKALYTPYHPAVLRLIQNTIEAGKRAGKWVGMCGSVAGNPLLFPILLAMGLEEFSMGPNQILKSRKITRENTIEGLRPHLNAIMAMDTSEAIEGYLKRHFGV